jgi:hypothetical protein
LDISYSRLTTNQKFGAIFFKCPCIVDSFLMYHFPTNRYSVLVSFWELFNFKLSEKNFFLKIYVHYCIYFEK